MARRRARPVRLAWEAGPPAAPRPAQLTRQSHVPSPDGAAPRGRLIEGDNLAVMGALLPELEARIDLVYIDPPFHSGKTFAARVGGREDSRRPATWETVPGFEDRWPDLPAYLEMLRPRLELIYRLLAPTGSFYVHLDWHISSYVRVLLDEIFGADRLLNEIVWVYHGPSPIRSAFSRKHDTILAYTKSARYTFNADAVRVPYDPSTVKAFAGSAKAGFGKTPNLKRGKVPEDWWFFPVVARLHRERTGYPTQKPLALLERIVRASSKPGDLVADFFCGSGTTLEAAARQGRRWLGCDSAPLACATTYHRLLLDCPQEGFDWIADASAAPAPLGPYVRLIIEGSQATVRVSSRKRFQWIEADWDDKGEAFQSQARAARPWRSAAPLPALIHRFARPGTYRVAVRAADAAGKIHMARVNVRIPRRSPRRSRRV